MRLNILKNLFSSLVFSYIQDNEVLFILDDKEAQLESVENLPMIVSSIETVKEGKHLLFFLT